MLAGPESARLSRELMRKLESCIGQATEASPFAKKTAIWLLRQSRGLTRKVMAVFCDSEFGTAQEVAYGIHNLSSAASTTTLPYLMRDFGSLMTLISVTGKVAGIRKARKGTATVWLSEEPWDTRCELVDPDYSEINAIEL